MNLPLRKSPRTHHKCVINRKTIYLINSKRLHLLVSGLVSRKMGSGASRGESSRKTKYDALLSLEIAFRCDVLPVERILIVSINTGPGFEDYAWYGITFLDGGGV